MDLSSESATSIYERYKKSAFPADGLLLTFTFILLLIGILNYSRLGQPFVWISTDCGIIIILLMLINRENNSATGMYYWLHFLWPIITLGFLYAQCTAWDNLIFTDTFDPLLKKWEVGLFGTTLNRFLAPAVNSLLIDELMHAFYFSYYLMLFAPAIWMLWRKQTQAFEMIFSLVLMMYLHFLFFIIFPGDGPIGERGNLFGRGVVFIPLMDFIYKVGDQGGGGAFPSTHVSSAVLIFLYAFKYAPKLRLPTGICCTGIIIATVYCSYHYSIDAIAGFITGTIFYFLGQSVYVRWRDRPARPGLAMQQSA